LAQLLAHAIYRWTLDPAAAGDPDCTLASRGRRIRPGDILVLVRRRNAFFEELVRDLKALDVPVAGVDRMVLSDQLAVMDLIALGQAMLLPEDDLTLAAVLKSPLFDVDEEQLFALAHGRPGSLWDALRRAAGKTAAAPALVETYALLSTLLARADYQPPYEFYADVLGRLRGRQRLLERLGPEAADAIEEILNQAMLYEQEQLPSLQGFLHWLASGAQEVKRDMEHGGDAVRVMTVHGAKGLQAPIVILPDTLQTPDSKESLFWLESEAGLPLWTVASELDGPAAASARAEARRLQAQEYRRLLYVALTRAEDRLYLSGWQTQKAPPEGAWYNLVARGLAKAPAAESFAFDLPESFPESVRGGAWEGEAWRLVSPRRGAVEEAGTETPGRDAVQDDVGAEWAMPLPDWARAPASQEPQPTRPLMPSRPDAPAPALRSPLGPQEGARFRRGRLIHKLLQYLPELAPAARPAAARKLIAGELMPSDRLDPDEIVSESLAVLSHPDFAGVFGPGSRAEVPIVGLLNRTGAPQVISGQVDRLVLQGDRLRIVDFKTNRPVPESESEVPLVYLRQLAAYRAILSKIYPGKSIDCAFLWTDAPRLMQISDALLAQHTP
jgi:ATP-dependent helicase/nuclease subunit A